MLAGLLLSGALLAAGPAAAYYPPDGTKLVDGEIVNPNDGMCVIGLAMDGTMLVDWTITTARDCVAYTKSADGTTVDLSSLGNTACLGGAGNDGYRHAWSTSLCYKDGAGLSRVDLDNTEAMCRAKGGSIVTSGKCVAYGWIYRNRKPDGTLPVTGTGITTTKGVQLSDGLGFCYSAMRMTTPTTNTDTTCPSALNDATKSPLKVPTTDVDAWYPCDSTANGKCQSQTAYNYGLGWSFSSSNCVYTYGVAGALNADVTKADNTKYLAGSVVDFSDIQTQGDCLALGGSWDNWLPNVSAPEVSTFPDGSALPTNYALRKLDAISTIEDGGGDFYSGTGAVCQKCHSDQSRSYAERDKPGYPNTPHRLSFEAIGEPFQQFFTVSTSDWKLDGVQCAMCHSTAKPAQDDLMQVVPAGITGPPAAGAPKSASGHNQTEYGSHLIDICYTCHGQAAAPSTDNPAENIPASYGELALTTFGLPPIANMFMNSPHGLYSGTSNKVDVGNKTKYASHFRGYVCRTAQGKLSTAQASCTGPNLQWYTTTNGQGNFCYYTQTGCISNPINFPQTGMRWVTTFDPTIYPWAVASAGGPGGVCAGVGVGSILSTYYRGGEAHRITNVNSASNPECENAWDAPAGTGTASGAAGFWVREGEVSSVGSQIGNPSDTSAGNCMTCHDVHWAFDDPNPEAEPLRRECDTCHTKNLNIIKHPMGVGTPLEAKDTEPAETCVSCHMPNGMHLFRISDEEAYSTFPDATQASGFVNTEDENGYQAAFVDLDLACGQCHGGGSNAASTTGTTTSGSAVVTVASTAGFVAGQRVAVGDEVAHILSIGAGSITLTKNADANASNVDVVQNPVKNNAPYLSKAALAPKAENMHNDAPDAAFSVKYLAENQVKVNASPTICLYGCDGYSWNWGDGSPNGSGVSPAAHTYATAGTKTITLTVTDYGTSGATATQNVTITIPNQAPVVSSNCAANADNWTMTITDTGSTDDVAVTKTVVNWGDATVVSTDTTAPWGPFNHSFLKPGTFTATYSVIDGQGAKGVATCPITLSTFSIGGTITKSDGTTPVGFALVAAIRNGSPVAAAYSNATTGAYTLTGLKPGTYNIRVTKSLYTFANPATTVTVGPSKTGQDVSAVTP